MFVTSHYWQHLQCWDPHYTLGCASWRLVKLHHGFHLLEGYSEHFSKTISHELMIYIVLCLNAAVLALKSFYFTITITLDIIILSWIIIYWKNVTNSRYPVHYVTEYNAHFTARWHPISQLIAFYVTSPLSSINCHKIGTLFNKCSHVTCPVL